MNGRKTNAARKALDNRRVVHLVDAVAIRRALLGTRTALTELERGAVITVCDLNGLDRNLAAQGLGVDRDTLDKAIVRRRTTRTVLAYHDVLLSGMRGPARDLVDAVRERDVCAVAEILVGLSVQGQYALAINLADMLAAAESGRDPGADDATAALVPTDVKDLS